MEGRALRDLRARAETRFCAARAGTARTTQTGRRRGAPPSSARSARVTETSKTPQVVLLVVALEQPLGIPEMTGRVAWNPACHASDSARLRCVLHPAIGGAKGLFAHEMRLASGGWTGMILGPDRFRKLCPSSSAK